MNRVHARARAAGGGQPAGAPCRSITGEPPQVGNDGAGDVAGIVRGEPVVVEELRGEAAVAEGVAGTVGARANGEEGTRRRAAARATAAVSMSSTSDDVVCLGSNVVTVARETVGAGSSHPEIS